MKNLPFEENKISENIFVRIFSQETDSDEFKWHRDQEDRIISIIGESNWKIQLDNEMPKNINNTHIPKNLYHRLIKGDGDLKLKIIKI